MTTKDYNMSTNGCAEVITARQSSISIFGFTRIMDSTESDAFPAQNLIFILLDFPFFTIGCCRNFEVENTFYP